MLARARNALVAQEYALLIAAITLEVGATKILLWSHNWRYREYRSKGVRLRPAASWYRTYSGPEFTCTTLDASLRRMLNSKDASLTADH